MPSTRRRPLTTLAAALVAPVVVLGLVSAQAAAAGATPVAPVPTDLSYRAVTCTGAAYVNTRTPTFSAATTDAVDHRPSLEFDLVDPAGVHTSKTVDTFFDSLPGTWTPTLGNDGAYRWRVRSISGSGSSSYVSEWSATQSFVLDTGAPAQPTTSSYDYPPNLWGAPTGKTISSTSASGGAVGYSYSWDFDSTGSVSDDACDYSVSYGTRSGLDADGRITVPTSLPAGYHTLYTKALDAAHNTSQVTSYSIYVSPSITTATGPLPTRLEGETLPVLTSATTAVAHPERRSWAAAGEQLRIVPSTSAPALGQRVTTTLTVGTEADYGLSALMSTASFYGKVAFELDGTPLSANGSPVFDAYSPGTARTSPQKWVDLGGMHLTRGTHTLGLVLSGRTATRHLDPVTGIDDQGYAIGLDLVTLAPVNRFTTASFADALNNHGIVDVDAATDAANTSADLGRTTDRLNLSRRALSASPAGLTRTASVTLDGVPFQLPRAQGAAGGYADNVVAIGQTIPIGPTPRILRSIDLVVAASCGDAAVPSGSFTPKFTVTQQGPDDQIDRTPTVPTVPDLTHPASTTATSVVYDTPDFPFAPYLVSAWRLPYVDQGTTPTRTIRPWIYHLTIPVDPNFAEWPVVSLTLPNLLTPFTGACGPSLHVLAMTPVA